MTGIPAALAAHFANDVTTLCQCWRVTRKDGTVSGFTDHDVGLSVDGTAFEPESGFTASETRATMGLATDTMDVEGALSSLQITEDDIEDGLYDGARVETLLVNWRAPASFLPLAVTAIGKITRSGGRFVAELQSLAECLDRPNGRTVRRACDAELGDARCGFDLATSGFSASGSVLSSQGGDRFAATGLDSFADDWFANGVLTWTSGANAGSSQRVREFRQTEAGTIVALWTDRPLSAEAGDALDIVAGCDKAFATCKAKFSNSLNFRGFPHLPGNDAAYGYATEAGEFDGGPLVP